MGMAKGFIHSYFEVFHRSSQATPVVSRAFPLHPQLLALATTTTFIYTDLDVKRTFRYVGRHYEVHS